MPTGEEAAPGPSKQAASGPEALAVAGSALGLRSGWAIGGIGPSGHQQGLCRHLLSVTQPVSPTLSLSFPTIRLG